MNQVATLGYRLQYYLTVQNNNNNKSSKFNTEQTKRRRASIKLKLSELENLESIKQHELTIKDK